MEPTVELIPCAATEHRVQRRPQPGLGFIGERASGMRLEQRPDERRPGVLQGLNQLSAPHIQHVLQRC
jgi:hypothetical protein